MTKHQALAIMIPALAYCCRNRGWFHTASVTRSPESTNSTFDCQRLSGHRPWRKSGYVSLANREKQSVYRVKNECGGKAHSCWMVGVRCPLCNQRQLPPASGTRPGYVLWQATINGPQGVRSRQLPAHVWGLRRMKALVSSQSAPGHLSLTLVHYGRTRIQ